MGKRCPITSRVSKVVFETSRRSFAAAFARLRLRRNGVTRSYYILYTRRNDSITVTVPYVINIYGNGSIRVRAVDAVATGVRDARRCWISRSRRHRFDVATNV